MIAGMVSVPFRSASVPECALRPLLVEEPSDRVPDGGVAGGHPQVKQFMHPPCGGEKIAIHASIGAESGPEAFDLPVNCITQIVPRAIPAYHPGQKQTGPGREGTQCLREAPANIERHGNQAGSGGRGTPKASGTA